MIKAAVTLESIDHSENNATPTTAKTEERKVRKSLGSRETLCAQEEQHNCFGFDQAIKLLEAINHHELLI